MSTPTSRPLTVLLPPSEGKAIGGRRTGWDPDSGTFGDALGRRRHEVVAALGAAGGGGPKLLGVSGPHLDRAQAANRMLLGAPTLPAWKRYTGVVWDHLDPATLTAAQRRSIVVVSGLHGLVRADDPIPDYRLKMGGNLAPLGPLSRWWRDALGDALAAASRRRVIVDLLPNEHRAAWQPPDGSSTRYTVVLRERSGGSGGHAAKAAKGLLARHLLAAGTTVDAALDTWRHDRFVLDVTV